MFVKGRMFPLLVLFFICAVLIIQIERAKRGKRFEIRKIPAMDAVDEIIGRATEMGRPVHYTTGLGDITGSGTAPRVLGGLEILSIVARRTAEYNAKLITTVCAATTYAVTEEMCRQAYTEAGHPERYSEDIVRFLSPQQYAYASAASTIITSEKCAGNMLIGSFGAESLILAEAGNMVGAIQLAGDTNAYQVPFFVVACDYTLIGEEMFAGAAYFSNDPIGVGSLAGQDIAKALALVIILAGVVLASVESPALTNLLKK